MKNIKLLDCTLRDGGYINDWNFGKDAISDITSQLNTSGVDIIELGFIKKEPSNPDRTVFNNMEDVKKLIGKKQPGRQYAVMAEVVNPLPLDMLAPYDDESPEIIRVIVWKRMLKEGYEYCKGIIEKGYKLCVQPARVSQYSDEEFVNMIKMFNELNPLAIYVVDSWGTMYKDKLLHYLTLADETLKKGIAVGYHGHNNMMQAFDVAQAFCEQKLNRDLLIDASVYGIGRGAGNLNTEIFAKYLNEKYGKKYNLDPLIHIYDCHIKSIYETEKWGYSVSYFISAKYNANPNFASYYDKLGFSNTTIEQMISAIPEHERIIFSKEKANQQIQKLFHKKLCLIIPTANRPRIVEKYIRKIQPLNKIFDIDIIFIDSSKNNSTRQLVKRYQACLPWLKYDFYDGPIDKNSIDEKVLWAYAKYAPQYDYVLGVRDRLLIKLDILLPIIYDNLQDGYDLLVINELCRDWKDIGNRLYTDPRKLFIDQCHQLTILGSLIVKSTLLLKTIQNVPLDPEKNYSNWQAFAFFDYLGKSNCAFKAASVVASVWEPIPSENGGRSFWHKNTLWQWGQQWVKGIESLPAIYDPYKPEVLKFTSYDCKPFSLSFLYNVQKLGGLSPFTVYKYQQYLPKVCNLPLWQLYTLSILPRAWSRYLFKRDKNWK